MPHVQLPIFADYLPAKAEVELAEPVDRDAFPAKETGTGYGRACDRCVLGQRVSLYTPCISAMGEPGGLLVVGESPGGVEDQTGKPFAGPSGKLLRNLVSEHWKGPVAYDNALRCFPQKSAKITDKVINACRGFLTKTLDEVNPTRIIALGGVSAVSLFGRAVPPLSSRGAYAYLRNERGKPTPVFFVLHPAAALRNDFVKKWFLDDMKNALTAPDPPRGPWDVEATIVRNEKLALMAERVLMAQEWASFDVETRGVMWTETFEIISVALVGSDDEQSVFVWPQEAIADKELQTPLFRMLTSRKLKKVGQNVKYDQLAFRAKYGIQVRPIHIDTRLQRKLIEPDADASLGKMAELVGMGGHKEEAQAFMKERLRKLKAAINKKTPALQKKALDELNIPLEIESLVRLGVDERSVSFALMPEEVLHRYNARDALATRRLAHQMERELSAIPDIQRMWDVQVRPAAQALERVEGWGVPVSKQAIINFDKFLEARETRLKSTLDGYANIQWSSPVQVANLLFGAAVNGGLGLPVLKETASGKPSTDAETLEDLAKKTGHPVPNALIEHRFVTKLRGTYAVGMLEHVRSDGRIHPNIKLDGARSGRTSCTDPNLQNIPRAQTVEGKMARDCFCACDEDHVLIEADYSQLELRVAAMLSGDKVMQQIFESGVDYHLRTAQLVSKLAWGIEASQVDDSHRSRAKSVNFGVLYGKTAGSLSQEWGVSRAQAQQVVDAIMGNFPELQAWCLARRREAEQTGFVWTWWGGHRARRRPLWRIKDRDDAAASVARNGAVNTPIQGTASDFCIASLSQCVGWIEDEGIEKDVQLVLAVHDSLMFHVHKSMVNETLGVVNEIMTGHDSMGVRLVADFKVGPAWGSMQKVDPKKGWDGTSQAA